MPARRGMGLLPHAWIGTSAVWCALLPHVWFRRGSEDIFGRDPELHQAATYGLIACGLIAILAGGVAIGIRLARD